MTAISIVKAATPSVRVTPSTPTIAVYHTGVIVTGGAGATDHGALTGLSDDDHSQYALADGTRGNFAPPHSHPYDASGTAASQVAAHHAPGSTDHDDRYYTEAEIDAALLTKADAPHSHSGSDIATGRIAAARLPLGVPFRSILLADVVNNNATPNTLQDITGLSFAVEANAVYSFYAVIPYAAAVTTTGSRWVISAPTVTTLGANIENSLTMTTKTTNYVTAVNQPASCNATSAYATVGNVAEITGVIQCSASGTFQLRFASEIGSSAITAKAGAFLEYTQIS